MACTTNCCGSSCGTSATSAENEAATALAYWRLVPRDLYPEKTRRTMAARHLAAYDAYGQSTVYDDDISSLRSWLNG